MTRLTPDPIDYPALTESVRAPGCGGVVLFLGTVRDLSGSHVTVRLDYSSYAPMAEKKLAEIAAEVGRRWPAGGVAIAHRVGRLGVGDVAVAVAVSCPHRAEAFSACRWAIDAVKELVPIWKKDHGPDGPGEWVHPGEEPLPPAPSALKGGGAREEISYSSSPPFLGEGPGEGFFPHPDPEGGV